MSLARNLCSWPSSKAAAAVSRYDMFSTWEERAFAEDSGGDLGSIWPPRSYSCSFCGREFRSAQALGGHMNVHRRDRARLKQSQSSQSDEEEVQIVTDHHDKEMSVPSSLTISCSDSDRGGVPRVLSGSSLLPVKRSAVSDSDWMFPSCPYWLPLVRKQEENKGSGFLGTRPVIYPTIIEAVKNNNDTNCSEKPLCIKDTRIFAHRPQAPSACCIDKISRHKRAKISDSCMLPRFLFDEIFTDDYSRKLGVTRAKVENREEIDLELRLGNLPEVK